MLSMTAESLREAIWREFKILTSQVFLAGELPVTFTSAPWSNREGVGDKVYAIFSSGQIVQTTMKGEYVDGGNVVGWFTTYNECACYPNALFFLHKSKVRSTTPKDGSVFKTTWTLYKAPNFALRYEEAENKRWNNWLKNTL